MLKANKTAREDGLWAEIFILSIILHNVASTYVLFGMEKRNNIK